jgi:hypothetical protein
VGWSFTYNTSVVLYKTEHFLSFSATAGQLPQKGRRADGRFSVPRKDAFLLMAEVTPMVDFVANGRIAPTAAIQLLRKSDVCFSPNSGHCR